MDELAGNPSQVYIFFRSGMVSDLLPGDAHVDFEMVNGPFYNLSVNAEAVSQNYELIDIAEITIDIELFCIGAGSGL